MAPFEFNAKHVLVTYAQCGDLDPWRVMERFSSLGAECIIGREHHEDGGLHLHVFADFGRKFRSRKTDILDVDGRHPNIVPSEGTPEKGYDYAIKDGDVVCGGLARPEPRRVGVGSVAEKWTRITQAENRDEFWALCHELDPKAAACNFNALSKYADWRFAEKPTEYEHPRGFGFVPGDVDGRDDWVSQSGIGLDESFLSKWVFAPNVALKRWGRFGGKPPAPPRAPLPLHSGWGVTLMLTKQGVDVCPWCCMDPHEQGKPCGRDPWEGTSTASVLSLAMSR